MEITEELLLGKLALLEDQLDVENISYKGYHIWPIVKDRLFFESLFRAVNERNQAEQSERIVTVPKGFILRLVNELFNGIFGYLSFQNKINILSQKYQSEKHEYIFIDGSNSIYIDSINGKKYSRYLSPYVEYINKISGCLLVNFTKEPELNSKFIPSFYINISQYANYCTTRNKIAKKIQKPKIDKDRIEELNQKLSEIAYPGKVNKELLGYMIDEINIFKSAYLSLFTKTKPKAVFIECYYGSPSNLGAILACKELKINSVDIQHGVSFDPMYLGWNKFPPGGFDLLPNFYWVWSKYDVSNILDTRKQGKQLQPILGGNLWYSRYLENKPITEEDQRLKKLVSQYKKAILITLDHSGPVYQCVFDAINAGSKDWLWLVRFHPHDYRDPGYREKYITRFKEIPNVHYEYSTSCHLFNVLSLVNFNISRYSSVCVEALTFKVPSVIIMCDEKIKQMEIFEKSNCFFYSSVGKEIANVIEKDMIQVKDEYYDLFSMRSEEDAIIKALNTIN